MRVGIADGRRAMRRPPGVRNSGRAVERLRRQLSRQVVELALGPPPLELPVLDRADAGGIITAIFEPLEAVEQPLRHVGPADNSNDSAHYACVTPLTRIRAALCNPQAKGAPACRAQCCWPQA